jgi:hypothetical protein
MAPQKHLPVSCLPEGALGSRLMEESVIGENGWKGFPASGCYQTISTRAVPGRF